MANLTKLRLLFIGCGIGALLAVSGCSSGPRNPENASAVALGSAEVSDSSVEIAFVLERTQRKLTAESEAGKVVGKYLRDRMVLTEGDLDQGRYADFLAKAYQFVQMPHRAPTSTETPCRAPFTVTVRIQKDTRVSTGCRGDDGSALSRLVKEGEFLLYSKK